VTDNLKQAALVALRLALRPVVRILLRNGITWKEAAEVCKETYVEVARADYGVHGRPTNASRIAIITGLSRHEVGRVRDRMADGEPPAIERMNSATRVLGGWHLDPEFSNDGAPAPLTFAAGGVSFSALCRAYAPDIPPTAMLKELQRVGAIASAPDDTFVATMRYYMPDSQDPDAVLRAGSVLDDLGHTIAFNLDREPDATTPTRFEGRASNALVRASAVPAFRDWLELEGQSFLQRADDWLAKHEKSTTNKRRERAVRLGVGVYQIQGEQKDRPGDRAEE